MSAIVFFATTDLARVVSFYADVGFETWLEQPDCTILRYDNELVGFCERDAADAGGIVTVVVDDRAAVDALYEDLAAVARGPPAENERYEIYQFFADDPDGRALEVQTFLHEKPTV